MEKCGASGVKSQMQLPEAVLRLMSGIIITHTPVRYAMRSHIWASVSRPQYRASVIRLGGDSQYEH